MAVSGQVAWVLTREVHIELERKVPDRCHVADVRSLSARDERVALKLGEIMAPGALAFVSDVGDGVCSVAV